MATATTNQKILNSTNLYNKELQEKLTEIFLQNADSDTMITKITNYIDSQGYMKVHIGNKPPDDPNTIWFDTSNYE